MKPIVALTSLSPSPARLDAQLRAIASWPVPVFCFQSPAETDLLLPMMRRMSNVDPFFFPIEAPRASINLLLDFARQHNMLALLINADIELRISRDALQGIAQLSAGGLAYFVRWNYPAGDVSAATIEPAGIDAFLLDPTELELAPSSFVMGQPFWDYWLPYEAARQKKPLRSVEFPVAFHEIHPRAWSDAEWLKMAAEFNRLCPIVTGKLSYHDTPNLTRLTRLARAAIEEAVIPIRRESDILRELERAP